MPNPDGTPTAAEKAAAGPGGDTVDPNQPQPLGVPKGFKATVPGQPTTGMDERGQLIHTMGPTQQVPARYFQGDEWKLAAAPPDKIWHVQQLLIQAGLIDSKSSVRPGYWDSTTAGAYKKLLEYANASGTDAGTAMRRYALAPPQKVGGDQAANVIQLTPNPDLEQSFRARARDLMGAGLTPDELKQKIDQYHTVETMTQTQTNQVRAAGTGQAAQAPSPDAFIESEIRKEHPTQMAEQTLTKQGGIMDALSSVIGKWQDRGLRTP